MNSVRRESCLGFRVVPSLLWVWHGMGGVVKFVQVGLNTSSQLSVGESRRVHDAWSCFSRAQNQP